MNKRQIKLADGRYLIFYTFEDENAPSSSADRDAGGERPEPDPVPEADEERRV